MRDDVGTVVFVEERDSEVEESEGAIEKIKIKEKTFVVLMYIYLTVIYLFEYVYLFVFKLISICDAVGLFFVDISLGDTVVIESFNIGLSWVLMVSNCIFNTIRVLILH